MPPRTPLWLHALFALLLLGTGAYLYASVTRVEETDELKYLHLSEKLDLSPSSYTLRGTALIKLHTVALEVEDQRVGQHQQGADASGGGQGSRRDGACRGG